MNTHSDSDVNARLEKLESTVVRLSKALSDRARYEQSPHASATRVARASAKFAEDRPATNVTLPAQTNAGALSKIRNALAKTWATLEYMSS
ncbi:hypothetical protein DyAD56_05945 [Dyella sp. AD56]|uniref:hypothetical protein n=1 Tax=Dyella sp. AD56 TaxID=1528744 RepID=UPI000CB9CBC1|nr:hypothetical protein [Dyella sp. AD56]PMQ06176.1 hypothetical protein DyAD56_05945 [Dyella sp. AD56]